MTTATRDLPGEDRALTTAIAEACRALSKAFRAWQLYLPNNPMRERAIALAAEMLDRCWESDVPAIRLKVREAELVHEGTVVLSEAERPTDGISWLLYRDGIREFTILPGCDATQIAELLSLLQRARQAAADDDDLVTILWLADLESVRYRYVEIASPYELSAVAAAAAGQSAHRGSESEGPVEPLATPAAESPPVGEGAPPGVIQLDEFDSTLYFLEPRELAALKEEVRHEFATDPRESVAAILLDLVETVATDADRNEAIDGLDALLVDCLMGGAYDLAATVLKEAAITARRAPTLSEEARQRLTGLPDRLSDPAVVGQLLQAIDEGVRAPQAPVLEMLVAELRGAALVPLLGWLTHAPPGAARSTVERATLALAERQTRDLVAAIESADEATALGAIRVSGQLRTAAAVTALSRQVRTAAPPRRAEVVEALAAIASTGALQALEPALDDSEREVRLAALRAIGSSRHTAAIPKLGALLKRRELRTADRAEKAALFDAFGRLCGDAGVPLLDGMLNGRSLLGPREPQEVRACAVRALALVGTERATASLRKSATTRDAVVRNEVARALRGATP